MNFKYFDNADKLLTVEDNVKCACCKQTKKCFGATLYDTVCLDCLASGKLSTLNSSNCSGDINELKKQIKTLNPAFDEDQVEELADLKTNELETTTPHLITWQDWDWPCADGDYCKFIGYGSKTLYNKLATNSDSKELFINSLYKHLKDSDTEYLWDEVMPDEEINSYEDSNQYGTLFYVFKSLNSDTIVTIWDCD
jgi:uncharacterized protein CbrC (UPF0167 family)